MVETIMEYAFSAGNLWAVLFVYLFLTSRSENKKREEESMEREKELREALITTNEQHLKISQAMENLERGMSTLSVQFKDLSHETREGFIKVWEKFGEIKK